MASRTFLRDDEMIAEINVIPLVDISLVLLIIFMVTANYMLTTFIRVDLPKAQYAQAAAPDRLVSVVLSGEGIIYFKDKPVTLKELKEKVNAFCRDYPDPAVVLNADKNVDFKSVVGVIDVLNELNLSKINIAPVNER